MDLNVRCATDAADVVAAEQVFAEGYPIDEAVGRPGSALAIALKVRL